MLRVSHNLMMENAPYVRKLWQRLYLITEQAINSVHASREDPVLHRSQTSGSS